MLGTKFFFCTSKTQKNKVNVSLFEVSTKYKYFLEGLKTKNQNVDLEKDLKVGSMSEPTTSGNWE